jgi:ribulose-5-phosphate 4-epimerase/fuculose-1-phosphate aldolase
MSEEALLREQICLLAKSMFDRGLTGGSTGNISARTPDGGLFVSPTGTSFGRLDPARLSQFDPHRTLIGGDAPTKEMPLHSAFYETRSTAGAVVHLHSCHSVALSMMPDANEEDFLPRLTPYAIMKLGKVKLLYRSYFKTRKFSCDMTRKLSETLSRNFVHSCGIVSRMNSRMASANCF